MNRASKNPLLSQVPQTLTAPQPEAVGSTPSTSEYFAGRSVSPEKPEASLISSGDSNVDPSLRYKGKREYQPRKRLTPDQTAQLKKRFSENGHLDSHDLEAIKTETGLTEITIKRWFSNRRGRLSRSREKIAQANSPSLSSGATKPVLQHQTLEESQRENPDNHSNKKNLISSGDSNAGPSSYHKKRKRIRLTEKNTTLLVEKFNKSDHLNKEDTEALMKETGLEKETLQKRFANRRAMLKEEEVQADSPSLSSGAKKPASKYQTLTPQQKIDLNDHFKQNPRPSMTEFRELMEQTGFPLTKLIKWFEDKRGLVARKAKNLAQADSPSLPSYATQPVSSAVSSSPALQSNVRTVSTASTTTSYWHAVPHREASHTQLLPVSTLLPEMMGTEQRGSFIDDRKIQPAPAQEEIDDFEDEIDDFEEEWESLQQMLDGQDPPLTYEFHILQNPTAGENNQQNVETTVPYYTQL